MLEVRIVDECVVVVTKKVIELTENGLLEMLINNTVDTIKQYIIPEDMLLKHFTKLDKSIIIENINLSEDFILKAIELKLILNSDIFTLNMSSYSNLSEKFIEEYKSHINWKRMMLYMISSNDNIIIENFVDIIYKNDLWSLISGCNLSIDFIRDYKEYLDWSILSFSREFTPEEEEEFKGFFKEKVKGKEVVYFSSTYSKNQLKSSDIEDLISLKILPGL